MRRRRLKLFLVVAVIAAVVALWQWPRAGGPAGSQERPFTELDEALSSYRRSGWEVQTRPKHPGPYRAMPGGDAVGADANSAIVCMVKGKDGAVLEELRLQGNPDYQQTVVHLETPGGRETLAVLRRPR